MKRSGANISKSVPLADRNDERMTASQDDLLLVDPQFGFTSENSEHLFDLMPMRGDGYGRLNPLFEYADLA